MRTREKRTIALCRSLRRCQRSMRKLCRHLSQNLYGFLKNHSCCNALLKMTKDWRRSLDNRESAMAVAVDLSKAFNSVSHNLLLANLRAYGLSRSSLSLMSSYLLGHKQGGLFAQCVPKLFRVEGRASTGVPPRATAV